MSEPIWIFALECGRVSANSQIAPCTALLAGDSINAPVGSALVLMTELTGFCSSWEGEPYRNPGEYCALFIDSQDKQQPRSSALVPPTSSHQASSISRGPLNETCTPAIAENLMITSPSRFCCRAYASLGVDSLYPWQAHCLHLALPKKGHSTFTEGKMQSEGANRCSSLQLLERTLRVAGVARHARRFPIFSTSNRTFP